MYDIKSPILFVCCAETPSFTQCFVVDLQPLRLALFTRSLAAGLFTALPIVRGRVAVASCAGGFCDKEIQCSEFGWKPVIHCTLKKKRQMWMLLLNVPLLGTNLSYICMKKLLHVVGLWRLWRWQLSSCWKFAGFDAKFTNVLAKYKEKEASGYLANLGNNPI